MKKKAVLKGLASALSLLLAILVAASTLLFDNAGKINQYLNVSTSAVVESGDSAGQNTTYYAQEVFDTYGADVTSKANALKVEMAAAAEAVAQAEEGTVVLRNNGLLPLEPGGNITVFGNASANPYYNKGKSESTVEAIPMVTFNDAMKAVYGSDHVDLTLADSVYSGMGQTSNSEVIEAPVSDVKQHESSWKNSNSTAVVVLARWGTEDSESAMLVDDGGTTRHYMGLMKNEMDLLSYLKDGKASGMFNGILVVINADQMMELGWLADYDVDACVLAGIPGTQGFEGVVNVISGAVNASGHTVDTYAANSLSAPAITYAGEENTQLWTNVADVVAAAPTASERHVNNYVIYAEGIYVGYKYYETRYEDVVMGRYGADNSVGSTSGNAWNYAEEMAFPFGYGLSYTTFEQTLKGVAYDEATDMYTVSVDVTNTGDRAGKSVVQVYAQTPYGEYEIANKVEKSAIQLAGFEKTGELAPGETAAVKVEIERYLLASYDSEGAEGYILSAGDYYLAIGDNCHDALNNVLAKKGYTSANGMTDAEGNPVDGNAAKVYTWNQAELDADAYRNSRYDEEVEVTNQFDADQLSAYGIDFTYLTRSDWAGTFPATAYQITATDDMMTDIEGAWYKDHVASLSDAPSVDDFTQGADVTMNFVMLKDVDWDDDELWDAFIDQLTVEEMLTLKVDNNGADPIDRVAMPSQARGDDGMCIQQGSLTATGESALSWVSEVMTSRTWNKERFAARGHMMGVEAVYCGLNELWYGGGNIHRTPFGGRNMQYYSEDGVMGYYVGWYEAESMQKLGVMYGVKHFALNDQEANRESLATFATEQSIREIYLRAFEGPMCKGGSNGIMAGFNRIGCRYVATHPQLLTNVLKGEWAFKGHLTTDAGDAGYKSHMLEQMEAGVDYTCWNTKTEDITNAIAEGDGHALQLLRLATKHNLYAASRSTAVNGLSSSARVITIIPTWQTALAVAAIVLTVLDCAAIAGWLALSLLGRKKIEGRA